MGINVEAEKRAYKKFIAAGMTPEGACSLIDNLEAESDGFVPNRVEYLCLQRLKENGKVYTDASYTAAVDSKKISAEEFLHPLPGKQYGYGLAQWTSPGRKAGLYNLAREKGVSIADEDMQIEFLLSELETNYSGVMKVLKTTHSIRQASDYVLKHFEQPADTGEAVCAGRAARGQKFYDSYVEGEISVKVTAQQVIDVMNGWIGMDRAKGTHKPILDIYNTYIKEHPGSGRGYQLNMKDSYCAATVSAAFIKLGAVDLIGGVECGVEEFIKIFKQKGIWNEDGTITPKPGHIICYNWDDNTQPNDGYADHIGIVKSVDAKNKTAVVDEGNISGKVGTRTIKIGQGNIRGYAIPKYADSGSTPTPAPTPASNLIGNCTPTLHTFLKGAQDKQVKAVQVLLKRQGFKGKDGKKLSIDGNLGENTAYAIEQFQRKHGMKDINFGTVAARTWELLISNAK